MNIKKAFLKFRKKIIDIIATVINVFVPKNNNYIFTSNLENQLIDCYDILNCGSSNMLKMINYISKQPHSKRWVIFVEYYDLEREGLYSDFAKKALENNVELRFYKSDRIELHKRKISVRIKNAFLRFRCKYWWCESGGVKYRGKLKCQKEICFNYYISCKNDYLPDSPKRWGKVDLLYTTSILASQIISSSTGVLLGNCFTSGFPRNDTLKKSERKKEISSWLKSEIGFLPKHIIVYAPTYRDYEENTSSKNRELFGYKVKTLSKWLKKTNTVLICKLHPWQNESIIDDCNDIIMYKKNYDFSFYDLLSLTDVIISDYSSISFDFLLLDRPIIYNLYDYDKYQKERSLSYDPYFDFCPGDICTNEKQLIHSLDNALKKPKMYSEDRHKIIELLHKYNDFNSTERVYKSLDLFADGQ